MPSKYINMAHAIPACIALTKWSSTDSTDEAQT